VKTENGAGLPLGKNSNGPSSGMSPPRSRAPGGKGGEAGQRKISSQDIQLVQNLIERCLQLYMSQREVVATLQSQAKIEPGFTSLVWQKLEEQNPEFFRAYYTRLKLKDQIVVFNHLLEQHVHMMNKLRSSGSWGPRGQQPNGAMSGGMMVPGGGMSGGAGGGPNGQMGMDTHPGSYPGEKLGWGGGQQGTSQGMGIQNSHGFNGSGDGNGINNGGMSPSMSPCLSPAMPSLFGESGGPGEDGPLGGGVNLGPLPRNFSLSDLSLDIGPNIADEGDGGVGALGSLNAGRESTDFKMLRNFSLSDMALLGEMDEGME